MGWGRKHATVDYVFRYDLAHLYAYHVQVMQVIGRRFRNFNLDCSWYNRTYRGKSLPPAPLTEVGTYVYDGGKPVYAEHDYRYLRECLDILWGKGAKLVNGTFEEMYLKLDLMGI